MKRIINYLVIIFILFMFIPSVNAKGVAIDSVEVDSKSNGAKILEDATVEDLSISFNVNFVEKNDFIKYKIVINNSTDENYIISESKNSSDYIEYIYEYDNKIIEKNKKSTMFVTIKYKNEVPIESLRNEGLFIENKNISINLDNSGNATIESNNPKTMNNYLILIVFLVLLFITVLSIKKKKGTLVLVILLFPVVALAIEKLEIKINTNIKITANPVCRMATTQHFERCEAYGTTAGYYCASYINYGSNIYFGNIENDGVLNVGDAFDCDVNNDGEYNPTTERFYYISPEDGDESSNNIVLLYYNNVIGGVPENSQPTIFCNSYLDMAPSVAYRELPTTTQWSNKLLYSNFERQIKTTSGKTYINDEGDIYNLPVFNYTDRAARLATYKELTYNCSTNHLENNCSFLLENTNNTSKNNTRGYWTESYYDSIFSIRIIRGDLREFGYNSIDYEYANGVRPVIVINRNNILY